MKAVNKRVPDGINFIFRVVKSVVLLLLININSSTFSRLEEWERAKKEEEEQKAKLKQLRELKKQVKIV